MAATASPPLVTGGPNRELLDEAVRFARALLRLADTAGPGMPYPRMRVLEILACDGPARMRDLARGAGLLPRNVTSVADALEADGMVRRVPHPVDRRATLLEITPRGRRQIEDVLQPQLAELGRVFDLLEVEDRARLTAHLHHLTVAIEDDAGSA